MSTSAMPQAVAFRAVYATRPEDTMDLDNAAAPTPHSSAPLSTPHPSAVETCPLNHANPPLPYHIDTLLGGLVNIPAVIAADDTKLIPPIDGGPKYAGVYFDTKRIGWKMRTSYNAQDYTYGMYNTAETAAKVYDAFRLNTRPGMDIDKLNMPAYFEPLRHLPAFHSHTIVVVAPRRDGETGSEPSRLRASRGSTGRGRTSGEAGESLYNRSNTPTEDAVVVGATGSSDSTGVAAHTQTAAAPTSAPRSGSGSSATKQAPVLKVAPPSPDTVKVPHVPEVAIVGSSAPAERKFKDVFKRYAKYEASFLNGKFGRVQCGLHATAEEAARARDQAGFAQMGKDFLPQSNFPEEMDTWMAAGSTTHQSEAEATAAQAVNARAEVRAGMQASRSAEELAAEWGALASVAAAPAPKLDRSRGRHKVSTAELMAVEPGFELWAGLEELPKSHTLEPIPMSKPTTKSAATAQSSSLELLPAFAGSSLPKGDADATPAGMSSSSASTAPPRSATAKADSTGYRGVVHRPHLRLYSARISHNAVRVPLGNFPTALEAAVKYDESCVKLRGLSEASKVINFPNRLEEYCKTVGVTYDVSKVLPHDPVNHYRPNPNKFKVAPKVTASASVATSAPSAPEPASDTASAATGSVGVSPPLTRGGSEYPTRSRSGFRGVAFKAERTQKPWHSRIKHHGRRLSMGFFDTAEEAARAYDAKVMQLFGSKESKKLRNFPNEEPVPAVGAIVGEGDATTGSATGGTTGGGGGAAVAGIKRRRPESGLTVEPLDAEIASPTTGGGGAVGGGDDYASRRRRRGPFVASSGGGEDAVAALKESVSSAVNSAAAHAITNGGGGGPSPLAHIADRVQTELFSAQLALGIATTRLEDMRHAPDAGPHAKSAIAGVTAALGTAALRIASTFAVNSQLLSHVEEQRPSKPSAGGSEGGESATANLLTYLPVDVTAGLLAGARRLLTVAAEERNAASIAVMTAQGRQGAIGGGANRDDLSTSLHNAEEHVWRLTSVVQGLEDMVAARPVPVHTLTRASRSAASAVATIAATAGQFEGLSPAMSSAVSAAFAPVIRSATELKSGSGTTGVTHSAALGSASSTRAPRQSTATAVRTSKSSVQADSTAAQEPLDASDELGFSGDLD